MERKKATLRVLMEGCAMMAEDLKLSMEPFEKAAAEIRAGGYRAGGRWPEQRVMSPDRKHFAQLEFEHETYNVKADLVITDRRRREVARERAFVSIPHPYEYTKRFGSIRWKSDHEVCLIDRDGRMFGARAVVPRHSRGTEDEKR